MNRLTTKKLLLIIVLATVSFSLSAQRASIGHTSKKFFKSHIYWTGSLGMDVISGEIDKPQPGFDCNLGLGIQVTKAFSIKGSLGHGVMRGKWSGSSGFKIQKGNYIESNISLNINVVDLFSYDYKRSFSLTPHIGVGKLQYRVETEDANGTTTSVGYKPTQVDADVVYHGHGLFDRRSVLEIPIGVEVGFKPSKKNPDWEIFIDYTATWTNTDLIDGHDKGVHNDWVTAFNIGAKHRIYRELTKRQAAAARYKNNWFVDLDLGGYFILGDVRQLPKSEDMGFNGRIGGGLKFGKGYKVYAKYGFATYKQKIRMNDAIDPDRVNFSCDKGNLLSIDVNLAYDIRNLDGFKADRDWNLYLHAGIGMIGFKAEGTSSKTGQKVYYGHEDVEEGVNGGAGTGLKGRRRVGAYSFGAELNYKLNIFNGNFDVYADVTASYFDSDLVNCTFGGKINDMSVFGCVGMRYNFVKSTRNRNVTEVSNDEIEIIE
ncbi:MAG: hypothetical protein KBT67_06635 [bacterium]|nr:hypothetical protein [Candidatus Limimorpha caballi]